MAFHPVISIRYADEDPSKEKMKVERIVRTSAPQKDKKKMGLIGKVKNLFNKFFSKFTGGITKNKQSDDMDVQSQDWIIEEDAVVGKGKFGWKQLQPQLVVVARDLVQSHVINLLRPYPPASRPGQFPAMRTGFLAKSVTWRWRSDSKKRIIDVGYRDLNGPTGNPAEYSQYLQHRGRLSVGDTASQMMPKTTQDGVEILWQMDGDYA